MELSNIEKLLEKYFEGTTTLSEEKELKVYFTGEKVSPELEKYRDLFQYFVNERQITASTEVKLNKSNGIKYAWVGAAASAVIIFGLVFNQMNTDTAQMNTENLGTYEDPELALQKTKEVLALVSQYMNEGKEDLVYLNEFENTARKLIK